MREHLAAAARHSAAARKELAGPACPTAAGHIWDWYLSLDAGRAAGGFGASPIGWPDLEAFARLTGVRMTAFELDCVRAMDRAALKSASKPEAGKK